MNVKVRRKLKTKVKIAILFITGIALILAGGFNTFKSAFVGLKNYFDAGERPVIEKQRVDNGDGTYRLSLSVKGDAEKVTQKVNVIVIVDRSGSMSESSGNTETSYTPTNSNGNNLYGLVNGEYVPLHRWNGWSGTWPNRVYHNNEYYVGWVNENNPGTLYTGQRYSRQTANLSRMEATQEAVNGLAEALLSKNGVDGNPNDTVEMALVSFATTAQTNVAKTTSANTFTTAVNNLNANGGTNWEAALQQANTINFGDNDPTFVIFFSDGSPTFRTTQAGYNDRYQTGVYGNGQEQTENMARAYAQATDDASALAQKYGVDKFYTIFAYGTTTGAGYMSDLTTAAGAPSTNNYSAENTAGVQQAFAEILDKIDMAGIANATINDGTTNQVSTSSGIVELLEVDESSYKYYRNGQPWTNESDPQPPAAQLVDGHVIWDLSSLGVLENDVEYEVTFDVYPSQTTYDYIADLKNGTITYNSLPSEVREYLKDDGDGKYSLETNTTATLTYTDTRVSDEPQTIEFTNPPRVNTSAETINVTKDWNNILDSRQQRPVTMNLTRDGESFLTFVLDGTIDDEWETAPWEATGINIATGLARLDRTTGTLEVLDDGHDYAFKELESEAYYWELQAETVHPMLINGDPTELILVEEGIPACINSANYCTSDGIEYLKLNNEKVYKISGNTNPTINAMNHRRSNLNISKVVDDSTGSAPKTDEFTFTIDVTQKDAKDKKIPDDPDTDNDDLWFSVQDSEGNWVDYGNTINGWTRSEGTDSVTGKPTYYYHAPNATNLVITLKNGDNLRFTNLISNTDFKVVEGELTGDLSNYVLTNITSNDDKNEFDIDSQTLNGQIKDNNKVYNVEFKNRYEKVNVDVEKIWIDDTNDGVLPDSVDVQLLKGTSLDNLEPFGDPVTLTKDADGKWKHQWKDLDRLENGQELVYDVKEITDEEILAHYISTKEGNMSDGFTITNTRDIDDKKVNVEAEKVWEDESDQDGIRPTSVTFNLLKNNEVIDSIVLDGTKDDNGEFESWKAKFEELPKYENGNEITYTIAEALETGDDAVITGVDGPGTYKVITEGDMSSGFTITNKHTPELTEATVIKVWKDADNQDGIRPTSLTVTLKADGEDVDIEGINPTVTLDDDNDWMETIEGLPKYKAGEEIEYTWTENSIDGYTPLTPSSVGTVYTLTNEHEPEVTTATVKKVWDDADNQDGIRPDTITVTLKANGEDVEVEGINPTVTLDADNEWTATIEGLPKNDNGEEIEYTWVEDESALPEGYKMTSNIPEGQLTTITNSYEPETTEVTVVKEWDDADNQDGIRPENITVTLKANGEDVEIEGINPVVTLDADNEWTATIEGLPKNSAGKEIKYTWVEDESVLPEGYEMTSNTTEGKLTTITNSYEPEVTTATIKKVWEDANNQDGIRPEKITVTLLGNGEPVELENIETTVELTESGNWTATIEGLPKNSAGEAIEYTWVEDETVLPEGYEMTSNITEGDLTTITNSYEPETTEVTVVKEWDDADDQDGIRPETIAVTLKANGEDVEVEGIDPTVTLDANNEWTATISGLPKNASGEEIEYTWVEDETGLPEGYEMTSNVTEGDLTTITNSYEPETTEVTVVKEWYDADNQDGIRPDKITVTLLGDGEPVELENIETTVELTESNNWKATIEGLPKNSAGEEIEYTWVEDETTLPEGYEMTSNTTEGDLTTITNSYEPETTDVTVVKEWDDAEDQDGIRPETITVTLKADGKDIEVEGIDPTVTLNANNEWTATIEGLPKNASGEEIEYTWVEDESVLPEGYEMTSNITEGDLTTITNSYEPEKTTATVKKVWDDADNQDGIRPESISVTLKANGEDVEVEGIDPTVTLDANNEWTATIEGLPKNSAGNEIEYTWVEDESVLPEGYEMTSNTTEGQLTTITNSYEPEKTTATVKKVWDDADDQDGIRPESISVTLKANGEDVEVEGINPVVTLDANNEWTATIEGLPKNSAGEEIEYTWVEDESVLPEGYEMTSNTTEGQLTTITNSYEPETTEVTVVKEWDDAGDQDGIRPETITVTLKANGEDVEVEGINPVVTLDADNDWTATIEGLPKNSAGEEIEYTWVEDETTLPEGYEMTSNITEGDTTTITNKHIPEVTEAAVKKVWDDTDNQDGIRPDELIVTLNNGTEVTLNEDNEWFAKVENLPKYKDGKEIEYSWTENGTVGYELTGNVKEGTLTTLTNYHKPEETSIDVLKVWDDADNQDGLRTAIEVELFKTIAGATSSTGLTQTLDEENGWFASFTGLDKNSDGELILYSVREKTQLADHTVSYSDPINGGQITVTNKHTPYTTSVKVVKVWDDADNQDGKRTDVTVNLMKTVNGTTSKVASDKITLSGDGSVTFDELPVNEGGKPIEYSVTEESIDGYDLISNNVSKENDGTWLITLTNKHEPELINIPVEKKWDNSKNTFGFDEPTEIKVSLKDGSETLETVTLSSGNWTYEFSNYPKYRDGNEIAYMVEEEYLADYNTEIEGSAAEGFTITNTYNVELINVAINKDWDDESDQDGIRPTEINAKLIGKVEDNPNPVYSKDITISGTNDVDTWSYEEKDLPKTYYGKDITYSVEEVTVDGYEAPTYSGDFTTTLIITNPYTPQTVSYKVNKVWDDDDNHDGKRPTSITVILKSDGTEIDRQILNEGNGWKYEFLDLPKCKNHGEVISYSIEEVSVDSYESNISVNEEGTEATITNTHENEQMDITITKTWIDDNNKLNLRPAEIIVNVFVNGDLYDRVSLNDNNNWAVTLTVDKYVNGTEAVYTISEVSVPEYITTIDGFNITNTLNHTEIVPPNTLVEVTENKDGLMSMIVILGTLGMTILSIRKRYE